MQRRSYKERALITRHSLSRKLFSIMHRKETNLGVTASSCKSQEVLELAEAIGPHICLLKTHVDILEDFSLEFARDLRGLADKHQFLIFEDRKYSETGALVEKQYGGGLYKVADWADLVSVHLSSGEAILDSLRLVGSGKGRGVVLLAESKEAGGSRDDSSVAVRWAEKHPDFVVGFECSRRLCLNEGFLHITSIQNIMDYGVLSSVDTLLEQRIGACGGDLILIDDSFLVSDDLESISGKYKRTGYSVYNQY
ncbi:orotidine 5'-phosphate decarboxylase / HUMPS family protein [Chlamydiifrater phoenicopteri]|uniref:orotidine 5'-phosphate decarboxylase / HUMPS family protein n=1 Tax=Chlamydiifrater phoenicopteri TaxID=2681469 RepID=UPI001BCE6198|nr:orotidine 5'-phosphate decarboxylase / HUMPS family protein [Chlamydiifrater phoenicopteri]